MTKVTPPHVTSATTGTDELAAPPAASRHERLAYLMPASVSARDDEAGDASPGPVARERVSMVGAIDPAIMKRISAALRCDKDTADAPAYLHALATKLEEVLPMQARVTRVRDLLFRKTTRIASITVELGACHYVLSEGFDGELVASCAMVSSDTVIASDEIGVDVWVDLLARDLAAYASSSAVARRTLARLAV